MSETGQSPQDAGFTDEELQRGNPAVSGVKVQFVKQPNPRTCVHACIAMVTGENIHQLIERFGDHGLSWHEIATVLIEHRLFPVEVHNTLAYGFPHSHPDGVYFASLPSLNIQYGWHQVIVVIKNGQDWILDPNYGREGAKAYTSDMLEKETLTFHGVLRVDAMALRKMRPISKEPFEWEKNKDEGV